jgi:hypothetical protein
MANTKCEILLPLPLLPPCEYRCALAFLCCFAVNILSELKQKLELCAFIFRT